MSINYAAMAAMVESMIAANGRAVTVLMGGTTNVDEAKPWRGVSDGFASVAPEEEEPYGDDTYAVFTDHSENDFKDTDLKRGDKLCLIAARSLSDLSQAKGIKDGSQYWGIVKCKDIQPGPTRLLYWFSVRQ